MKGFLATSRRSTSPAAFHAQKRHIEYWGFGVTARMHPGVYGENLSKCANQRAREPSAQSMYMTGANHHTILEHVDDLTNGKYLRGEAHQDKWYHRKLCYYVPPEIRPSQVDAAAKFIRDNCEAAVWFQTLFRDYPSFAKVLDPEFQERFREAFIAAIEVCAAEQTPVSRNPAEPGRNLKAEAEKASHDRVVAIMYPLVMELFEKKSFHQPSWWRLHEALMETADSVGVRKDVRLAIEVAAERVVKISLNRLADEDWGCQYFSHPYMMDIVHHRVAHECPEMWDR